MEEPLLLTKFHPPSTGTGHIRRPRLLKKLNSGINGKLTLVSASAGFGKSSLISQWLSTRSKPSIWLSLDENDNSGERFLNCFLTAIRKLYPDIGNTLIDTIQSPRLPSPRAIMTVLINELINFQSSFILTIDDYHRINCPEIDEALSFLLMNLPQAIHLVIISREDPAIPLGRLRSTQQLTEIRTEDLRFNRQEIEEFLGTKNYYPDSRETASLLEEKTEGWITGLQLADISISRQKDPEAFIRTFTGNHQFILDYLMEEVLENLEIPFKNFLYTMAICERFCLPLCEVLFPSDGSCSPSFLLEKIQKMNLFLIPLDSENKWFRFHHLFRDFLCEHCGQNIKKKELHLKAARWFDENNYYIDAFHHYSATEKIDLIIDFIERNNHLTHQPGYLQIIIEWLNSLPASKMENRPELWLLQASYLLSKGKIEGVAAILDSAEKGSNEAENNPVIKGQIAIARATLAMTSYDMKTVDQESDKALKLLPPDLAYYLVPAIWMKGMVNLFSHQLNKAAQYFSEAIRKSRTCRNNIVKILATIGTAQVLEEQKQNAKAIETYNQALSYCGTPALPVAGEAHLGLSRIYTKQNHLETALEHLELAEQFSREYDGEIDRIILCQLQRCRILRFQKKYEESLALVEKLENEEHNKTKSHRLKEIQAEKEKLLSMLNKQPLETSDLKQSSENQDLIDPLSPREIEVLSLIEKGKSNQEICEILFLAMDTVKGHNRRIFRKLEVSNRTQAANKARELNLIP